MSDNQKQSCDPSSKTVTEPRRRAPFSCGYCGRSYLLPRPRACCSKGRDWDIKMIAAQKGIPVNDTAKNDLIQRLERYRGCCTEASEAHQLLTEAVSAINRLTRDDEVHWKTRRTLLRELAMFKGKEGPGEEDGPWAKGWEERAGIRSDETTRDETGWLIEVELGGRPHYWKGSADARCIGEFDPDANAALRLSREKDARDLALFLSVKGAIALSDVRKIKITEHMWPCSSLEPSPPHPGPSIEKAFTNSPRRVEPTRRIPPREFDIESHTGLYTEPAARKATYRDIYPNDPTWWKEGMTSPWFELPSTLPEKASCVHEWVDARNEVITSGELCVKCGAVRAGNGTRDDVR